jgi:hypothetical protein
MLDPRRLVNVVDKAMLGGEEHSDSTQIQPQSLQGKCMHTPCY